MREGRAADCMANHLVGPVQGVNVENLDEYGAEMPCFHSGLFFRGIEGGCA